jgi:hypothetical protein
VRRGIALSFRGLLIALTLGRPLGAQSRTSVDLGFSVVQFVDDSSVVIGPSMGVMSAIESRRMFGQISAGGVGTVGAASGSATLTGGLRTAMARLWLLEGAGELAGVAGSSSRAAATGTASVRVLRVVGSGGAWARLNSSLARRESGTLPGQAGEVGAWWGWTGGRATASLLEQHATGQLFTGPLRQQLVGTIPVRYAEGALGLRVEGDDKSLELSVGVRRDPDAAQLFEPLASMTAAFWTSPTRAWTISLSRMPADFVRGADAARWIAIGMRFNEPTPAAARAERVRPIVQLSGGDEGRVVRVLAPGARSVELMADFTEWQPVALTSFGSRFERALTIAPGSHRILIRIDGGRWRPAANTPAVGDDLGGRVGLLVVQ